MHEASIRKSHGETIYNYHKGTTDVLVVFRVCVFVVRFLHMLFVATDRPCVAPNTPWLRSFRPSTIRRMIFSTSIGTSHVFSMIPYSHFDLRDYLHWFNIWSSSIWFVWCFIMYWIILKLFWGERGWPRWFYATIFTSLEHTLVRMLAVATMLLQHDGVVHVVLDDC